MSARRKHKSRHKKNAREPRSAAAPARPLPTPEEVVGAVVDAIAAPFLDESAPDEPGLSERSGVHTIVPRRGEEEPPIGQREEEHRAHPRVQVNVAIGLESESHFFAGLTGDLSEGGVFVQTYRDLPVGSRVDLLLDLPDGQRRAPGQVRWHRSSSDSSPPGLGIAFEGMGQEEREAIHRFCEERAPLYYEVDGA